MGSSKFFERVQILGRVGGPETRSSGYPKIIQVISFWGLLKFIILLYLLLK